MKNPNHFLQLCKISARGERDRINAIGDYGKISSAWYYALARTFLRYAQEAKMRDQELSSLLMAANHARNEARFQRRAGR